MIYDLFEIPEDILFLCGGKAARLCVMKKAGFNVPDGFIIYGDITDAEIETAADRWEQKGLGSVAVRSSASGEDSSAASAAGQYETVLGVNSRKGFVAAVHACVDSLHGKNAGAYNSKMAGKTENRMTVLVQRMVQPYAAGVCFSKDPNGGGVLVEAVRGLGEQLVSGSAAPDEYRVRDGRISRTGDILTDAQVTEIARGTQEIAKLFRFDADTEWAIRDDVLYWLQARPITVEEAPDISEFDTKNDLTDHVLTTCNISEMMPGAVTPLSISTSVYGIEWGVRKLLVYSHAYESMDEVPPYSCYVTIGNHLFADLTSMYRICKKMAFASKPSIDMSICGRELKDSPEIHVDSPSKLVQLRNFMLYISSVMAKDKACRDSDKFADMIHFDLDAPADGLWRELDGKLDILNNAMYCHYITSAFSGSMSSALNLNLAAYFDCNEDQHAAVAGCLEGIPEVESADILRSFRALADAVKAANPGVEFTRDSIESYVVNGNDAVRAAYDDLMTRHGHRSIRECEMRSKSLCDDPETFYSQLTVVINSVERHESDPDSWKKNRAQLLSRIPASQRMTFKVLIDMSRTGARVREYTKSRIVKATYKFKQGYCALGEKLAADGILPDSDCIYFLTHDEIGKLISTGDRGLIKKALGRRRVYPEQQRLRFADITYGRPEAISTPAADDGKLNWQGTPVSRGVAEGCARVVSSVEDANALRPGEIMVAGFTDVGWTPYYCMLGGLVTEVGAALSHGAVVAREYSLPLVTNIQNITYSIHTGDRIRIDGAAGTVTVLERAV